MEKSSKRGKIPQSDWPLIMARYEAGETLASIARTYDCSPPAISYVVSKSRARQPDTQSLPPAPSATEPQLIKAAPAETAATGIAQSQAASAPPADGPPSDRRDEIWLREANGFARDGAGGSDANLPGIPPRAALPLQRPLALHVPAGPGNGDHRRTLHLSLGSPSPGNGATPPAEHHPAERQNSASEGQHAPHQTAQHQTTGERFAAPANPGAEPRPAAPPDGGGGQGLSEVRPTAYYGPVQQTGADGARRKEGGVSYIDKELRARVDGDIAAFLAAFDAALVEDTQESRSALREATDRLLRAGARTRIELERLEARMPLPPRDNGGRGETAWRQR
jgi:hypothetical protein